LFISIACAMLIIKMPSFENYLLERRRGSAACLSVPHLRNCPIGDFAAA